MSRRIALHLVIVFPSVLAIVLAAGASCQQPAKHEHLATADEDHGLHMVNNVRLRVLMDELRALNFERTSDELAAGSADQSRIQRIAVSASALAADARMIPITYRDLEMSAEIRRVFDQQARQLHEHCRELESMARRADMAQIRKQLDQIISTCNECHANFRGPRVAALSVVSFMRELGTQSGRARSVLDCSFMIAIVC
ncbi:MAG: cytochrome c [Planctomycetes bacterium]|nr:cytochrome c [Planctomycetota bacterium]